MSSLSMSVLLLAICAIALVVGYNVWMIRRRRKALGASTEAAAAARAEPSLGLGAEAPDEASTPPARGAAASVLDARTDCIVELSLPSLVAGERLVALAGGFRRAGSKPVVVEAARTSPVTVFRPDSAADEELSDAYEPGAGAVTPVWRAPSPGVQFDRVRIGVLLANRTGALNAMEFSDFVAGVQVMADQLSALVRPPEMGAVLARARELDEFCANLDAQLGIGVDAPDPLGLEDLGRLAGETACIERGNNRYARLSPQGELLFSLSMADAPNRLALLLDVPRAPAAHAPWAEMVACARLCAQRLGGRLVDDAGRPLSDAELDAIGAQVQTRQQRLSMIGIDAGSPLALRLFN